MKHQTSSLVRWVNKTNRTRFQSGQKQLHLSWSSSALKRNKVSQDRRESIQFCDGFTIRYLVHEANQQFVEQLNSHIFSSTVIVASIKCFRTSLILFERILWYFVKIRAEIRYTPCTKNQNAFKVGKHYSYCILCNSAQTFFHFLLEWIRLNIFGAQVFLATLIASQRYCILYCILFTCLRNENHTIWDFDSKTLVCLPIQK